MPIRVLIVEDNAVARGFLARVVRESFSDELSFVEAAGIEAASAALDLQGDGTEAFRLILCDLEQPDQAGLTLLARLAGLFNRVADISLLAE